MKTFTQSMIQDHANHAEIIKCFMSIEKKNDRFAFIHDVALYNITLAAICATRQDVEDEIITDFLVETSVYYMASKNVEIVADAVMAAFIIGVDLEVFFKDHPLETIFELVSLWGVVGTPEHVLNVALLS